MPTTTIYGDTSYGVIGGSNAAFATARGTATVSATANQNLIGVRNESSTFIVRRAYLRFDTSSIPDGATIQSVTFTGTISVKNGSRDDDLKITQYTWSSPITTSDTDYDGALTAGAASAILWSSVAGLSVDTPATSSPLTTSWVNKTGYTYLVIIADDDITNTAPGANTDSTVSLRLIEDATEAYRPYITVSYALLGGTATIAGAMTVAASVSRYPVVNVSLPGNRVNVNIEDV